MFWWGGVVLSITKARKKLMIALRCAPLLADTRLYGCRWGYAADSGVVRSCVTMAAGFPGFGLSLLRF